MIARAGDGVSARRHADPEDGEDVTATVRNGWAIGLWPGSHEVTGGQLRTATGTQSQAFPLGSCGLHNCTGGGPHGGAPARRSGRRLTRLTPLDQCAPRRARTDLIEPAMNREGTDADAPGRESGCLDAAWQCSPWSSDPADIGLLKRRSLSKWR